jgi:hypothetical protein
MLTELITLSAPLMGLVGVSERVKASARIIVGAMALTAGVTGVHCREDGETILIRVMYEHGADVEIRVYDFP